MKNITQLLASICLSLLTIGAIGQNPIDNNFLAMNHNGFVKDVSKKIVIAGKNKLNATHRHGVNSPLLNGQFNYPKLDEVLVVNKGGSYSLSKGWKELLVNSHFVVADTAHPKGSGVDNLSIIHQVTVSFDSVWDWYYYSNKKVLLNPKE